MNKAQELMRQLKGWDALEIDSPEIKEIREAQRQEGLEIASLFHQTFVQNDAGARLLEIMMQRYLIRTVPDGQITAAGRHAGKADLVREILLNLELAENP